MVLRDLEVMSEIQGVKIWWRWCNYSVEPLDKLYHVKYVGDNSKEQLIIYNEECQGSHIWRKYQAGQKLMKEHRFCEI